MHNRSGVAIAVILLCRLGIPGFCDDSFLEDVKPPEQAVLAPLAHFSFDQDGLGKPPARFKAILQGEGSDVRWEVRQDRNAPTPPNIVVQAGKAKPGANFSIQLLEDILLDYGEVGVHIKALSSDDVQTAGVVYKYIDDKNFYRVSICTRNDTCQLIRVKKGKAKLLASGEMIMAPYKWHELQVVFTPVGFTVLVNKEIVLGAKEKAGFGPGMIGFWTQGNSSVAFDDFRVSKPDSNPPVVSK